MFSDLVNMMSETVTGCLGTPAVYGYSSGGSENINVVFAVNREYYEGEAGVVTGVSETILIKTDELAQAPVKKDTVSFKDKNFIVIDVDHDGQSSHVLSLRLV